MADSLSGGSCYGGFPEQGVAMVTTQVHAAAPFNAKNRCDLCGLTATTRAVLWSGGELVFCDPHLDLYQPRLTLLAARYERYAGQPAVR